jgi:anti-sigma factor RsiW
MERRGPDGPGGQGPMNCSEAERLFDPYLDGELSGSLRLEFDAHRLRCTLCQRKLAMMEACEHILAGDSRVPPLSMDFTDKLMAQITERKIVPKPRRIPPLKIAIAVGLQAAAVIGFVVFWPSLRPAATPTAYTIEDVELSRSEPVFGDFMRRGVENVWAARSNFAAEVSALPNYAMSFALTSDRRGGDLLDSLHWLFDFVPIGEDGDSTDGEADASENISL